MSAAAKLALAALDARIAALPAYSAQAGVLQQTVVPVEPTHGDDDVAPWAGFAADIRSRS